MTNQTTTAAILSALAAPFDRDDLKFRPGAVSGNRALALPYIDARAVMERLDTVVGAANWQDAYELLPDGSALCRLQLRLDGEWIVKADVGGPSEQSDEGDRHKAAVSDALKRAAVKWGIGRFLYSLPQIWADFDPAKKRFVRTPELPRSAVATTPPPGVNGKPTVQTAERPTPATSAELAERLQAFGVAMVKAGLCANIHELLSFVRSRLGTDRAPLPDDPAKWPVHLIGQAMQTAKTFEGQRRNGQHVHNGTACR